MSDEVRRAKWLKRLSKIPRKQKRGKQEWFYDSGQKAAADIQEFGKMTSGDAVLDVGCGNGRVAIGFADTEFFYVGVDVQKERIKYCRKLFTDQGRMEFVGVNVNNPRYRPYGPDPLSFKLEWPGEFFKCAIAINLFTHLKYEKICTHYMKEIERMLVPKGRMISTWLTDPPLNRSKSDYSRTIFTYKSIKRMHEQAGFTILEKSGNGVAANQLVVRSEKIL